MFEIILLLVSLALGEVFRPKPKDAAAETAYSGPTASEARPVPVIWGTPLIKNTNILWGGDYMWGDITEVIKTGIVGTHKQIVAYSYYMGIHLGICMGAIDKFRAIRAGDKVLHQTNLSGPYTYFNARCAEKAGQSFYIPTIRAAAPNDLIAFCEVLGGDGAQPISTYVRNMTDGNLPAYRGITSLLIHGPSSAGHEVDMTGYVPLPHPDPVDPPCPPLLPCPAGENERVPLSMWALSGNVGIDPHIQPYWIIASRWPKSIPNGNGYVTTGADTTPSQQMNKICHGATTYMGFINMFTDPHLPAASSSNKGQFYVVNVASPGAGMGDTELLSPATPTAVTYTNIQSGGAMPWYLGDLIISSGTTWYRSVGFDANPAEMIWEAATSDDDFVGIPAEFFMDYPSMQLAAKQLYDEGFGLTLQFDRKMKGRTIIDEILRHIDGVFYMDVGTGKFKLKLIRNNYTVASLPIFDESNIKDLLNFSRSAWDETTNEVKVTYMDSAANFTQKTLSVQDLANINVQENIVTATMDYPGITSRYLANRVAYRDLRALSFPLGRCNFTCNRKHHDVGPGDPFIFRWGPLGITQVVMRMAKRRDTGILDGGLEVEAVQDVFSLGASAYTDIDPTGTSDTTGGPAKITVERLLAAPFHFTQDNAKVSPMALAARPNTPSFRYNVYERLSSVPDYLTFDAMPATVPTGLLMFNYSKSAGLVALSDTAAVDQQPWDLNGTTQFVLQSPIDLRVLTPMADSQVRSGYGLALVDSEIVGFNWVLAEKGVGVHDLVYPSGTRNGTLTGCALSTSPVNEQWTVTALTATTFSVVGSVSGAQAGAVAGMVYDNGKITFLITAGTGGGIYVAGDVYRIDVNTTRNGTYWFWGIWRGLLDTVAADHAAGARVWFIGGGLGTCPTQFSPTDAIKVKMTALSVMGQSQVSDATELSLTFNSESLRPYPPGNTKVNALTWPAEITGQPTVTWNERNRITQLLVVKQDEATVAPEAGTTYTLKFYRYTNEATSAPFLAGTAGGGYTLIETYAGLAAGVVTKIMTLSEELAGSGTGTGPGAGIAGGTRLSSHLRSELYATAAGLDSNQKQIRDFDCAGADMLADFYADQ